MKVKSGVPLAHFKTRVANKNEMDAGATETIKAGHEKDFGLTAEFRQ